MRLVATAREHYRRFSRFLDISVLDGEVYIRAPRQLMGILIGSKGRTINALRDKLKAKVHIEEGVDLTQRYADLYPEVTIPPEEAEALTQLFDLLKRLEKYATPEQLLQLYRGSLQVQGDEG
jgi:pyruvate/oxaloacetate carboxyltransferase